MTKYLEYKDSGVECIGAIPKHWELKKMRSILKPISKKNRPDLPLLSVVREKGVIMRNLSDLEENHNYIPDDLSNYKVVKAGQFAMNKMKAWQGSYGISKYDGIVSPAYFVFNLKGVEPEFFHITARSKAYIPFFAQASDGIRVGQWDLNQERMKEIPFWVPSSEEQQKISRYLDWKTTQINKFIKAKERMIELLKEQKLAIINEAISGKINPRTGKPYDNYKDSGVDWLGYIPADWMTIRLKYLVRNITEQTKGRENNEPYIALENVESWSGRIVQRDNVQFDSQVKRFRVDDVLFGKLRPYLAKVVKAAFSGVCVGEFLVLRPLTSKVLPDYIEMNLRSKKVIDHINKSTFGARMPRADWDYIGSMVISLPLSHEDQNMIVEYILRSKIAIDRAIVPLEREIALMNEYKDRLIADAVTGKVNVRNIPKPAYTDVLADIEQETTDNELDQSFVN